MAKSNAEQMRKYRARNLEAVRERERERMRTRRAAGWREDPLKKHARNAVASAVRRGKLVRLPCEVCGEPKSQAHHPDYLKPLDVQWLCRPHHDELHRAEMAA